MTSRSPRGRIGSTIKDKYRVDTFLATGSMANVYAATHRNGGKVALKILHRELANDPQMRERFKREGYFCNAIDHPAIAKAIDDDVTDDECPYIVMELLEGENLEVRRKRLGGRLPLGEVLNIADQVLDVLAAAHDKGILHRDLKPENVFVTHDGAVKLLDFGVARWNDGKQSSDVTAIGMVLGTPAFMPPEQALGLREEVDARSDLWALGATLFTLLTGESVHTGDNAKAKLVATATKPARKLREVLPNLPSAATSVLDRALEYHRTERWDDARAMREALRWARMSLDPEADVLTSSSPMIAGAAPAPGPADTARRIKAAYDDEPTVMRKGVSEEDVFTSAPPITTRATIPDDPPAAMSESSESLVFSLQQKKESEHPPSTERLPGPGPDNDLGLPPLVDEPPTSEDIPLEYTRPMMAAPAAFRGTLPLPNAPPANPSPTTTPATPATARRAPASPLSRPAPSPSPPAPAAGTKIFLGAILVAMLGGTVVVLMMTKGATETHAAPTGAAIVQSPPSATASASATATASASASVAPPASVVASETPPASASVEPVASASAAPIATAKPRPRPKPSATASASPTTSPTEAPTEAPTASAAATATATATATTATTATTTATQATATAEPSGAAPPRSVPMPTPDEPSPSPSP